MQKRTSFSLGGSSSKMNLPTQPPVKVTTVNPPVIIKRGSVDGLTRQQKVNMQIQEVNEIFRQAMQYDNQQQFDFAFRLYMDGLSRMVPLLRDVDDESVKNQYKEQVERYMQRTEQLKDTVKNMPQRPLPTVNAAPPPQVPNVPAVPTHFPSVRPSPSYPTSPSAPNPNLNPAAFPAVPSGAPPSFPPPPSSITPPSSSPYSPNPTSNVNQLANNFNRMNVSSVPGSDPALEARKQQLQMRKDKLQLRKQEAARKRAELDQRRRDIESM